MNFKKILVVDDEQQILDTLQDLLLLNESYIVETCSDSTKAIQKITKWKPDLILCDIMMPHIDGMELLNEIRGIKDISHIPLIFVTAKSHNDTFRNSMNLGADDFITKPFDFEEVKNAINSRFKRINQINNHQYFDFEDEFKKYKNLKIKSPFYGILGSLDILNKNTFNNDENISESTKLKKNEYQYNRTFQNIMLLYESTQQPHSYRNYQTPLKKIIKDVIFEICNIYEISESRFDLELDELYFNVKPIELSYLLFELLTNSVKFSPYHSKIEIKSLNLKNHHQLIIKDYGPGFTYYEMRVISPLKQFKRTNESGGLGLGLSLCKKLMAKHNGEIKIYSKPNESTKFSLKFPKFHTLPKML